MGKRKARIRTSYECNLYSLPRQLSLFHFLFLSLFHPLATSKTTLEKRGKMGKERKVPSLSPLYPISMSGGGCEGETGQMMGPAVMVAAGTYLFLFH